MRIALILALSAFLISCASLKLGGEAQPEIPAELPANPEDGNQMGFNSEGSNTPVQAEQQSAEHQSAEVANQNEQRSTSELDAAAPEGGTDTFHASINQTPGIETTPGAEIPTQLPEKNVASWDQHASASSEAAPDASANFVLPPREEASTTYDEPESEKPAAVSKKSKKSSKFSKKDKKSKKALAKNGKKSKKALAKKSKSQKDCGKIVKASKKSTKKAIAMCKADKKKLAQKSKKSRKLASSGSSSVR